MDVLELKKPETNFYKSSISPLANGFLKTLEPPLIKSGSQLNELTNKQQHLAEDIHKQNLVLSEVQHSDELQEMFVKMKIYLTKLQNAKKDLKVLHEKSTKLKKRAIRLQKLHDQEALKTSEISETSVPTLH